MHDIAWVTEPLIHKPDTAPATVNEAVYSTRESGDRPDSMTCLINIRANPVVAAGDDGR